MKLKKLKIVNIRSYENQEIEFPEGSLLLSGDIGSGKTTILLAIEYALFSLQPGQRGSSLLRNGASSGEVSLEFEVDGKDILVERRLKRKEKSVSNEYAAITIDGEKEISSVTEIKNRILNLLGYPREFIRRNNILYRYTVYTPQEEMKQIILEDPDVRLNILRHIFGIDKYKRIRENLTITHNYLRESSKILLGETKSLDMDKESLVKLRERLIILSKRTEQGESELEEKVMGRKAIELESKELEEKLKEKDKLESEVEKTNLLIATKKNNIASLDKEAVEILKALSEVGVGFQEERLRDVLNLISSTKERINLLDTKQIETISKMNYLEQNREDSIRKRERIFKIDICPTCLQDVPENHKHNIMNEAEQDLAKIRIVIEKLEMENMQIIDLLEKEKLQKTKLEEEKLVQEVLKSKTSYIEVSRKKLLTIEKQKEDIEKDVLLLFDHLKDLKENILGFSKFTNFFRMKLEELKTAFVMEKNSEIFIAELRKEIELTQEQIANLEGYVNKGERSKKKLSDITELNNWLSGQFLNLIEFIERNVLMKLRTEFSKLFSKWFSMLVPSDSFNVHLDENFTPLMVQGETEMDYQSLSGGERTAVALAYRLALNQTINSILSKIKTKDIVMLDEPTDGFSEAQLGKMRDVLEELDVSQLIVVSHESKVEDFVDSVLKIKKESNCSILEPTGPQQQDLNSF